MTTLIRTDITVPAKPFYGEADAPFRSLIDMLEPTLRESANWKVRRKVLNDRLLALYEVYIRDVRRRTSAAIAQAKAVVEPAADPSPPVGEPDGPTAEDPMPKAGGLDDLTKMIPLTLVVHLYVGTALERLGEAQITTPEQAFFYALSCHPEHRTSAQGWIDADHRNGRAIRKMMREERPLTQLLDRIAALDAELAEVIGSVGAQSPASAIAAQEAGAREDVAQEHRA